MSKPAMIASIVEGHGEVAALPVLIQRIAEANSKWVEIPRPYRLDSGKIRKPSELAKAVRIVAARVSGSGGVLVLRDGDDVDVTCPVELAREVQPEVGLVKVTVEVVIARHEYESWFLASIKSLRKHPSIKPDAVAPVDPEKPRGAKAALEQLMTESYKETLHQPKFSALIDIDEATRNSRSFRRLRHAIENLASRIDS